MNKLKHSIHRHYISKYLLMFRNSLLLLAQLTSNNFICLVPIILPAYTAYEDGTVFRNVSI